MDSFDLFTEFGISSTPKAGQTRLNVHIRFDDDGNAVESDEPSPAENEEKSGQKLTQKISRAENDEKSIKNSVSNAVIAKDYSFSTSSSVHTVDEIHCTPEEMSNSVDSADVSAKFTQFLEKLGFKDGASKNLDEKLDFVMKAYDELYKENEKLKLLLSTTDSTLSFSKLESDANDLFIVDTKLDPSNLTCQSESTYAGEISHNGIGYCTDESPSTKPKVECYNCGGDHVVSDCKEALDRQKIQARRRLAVQQKISTNKDKDAGKKRYAEEHSKFRPGHVSQELRRALGLRSRDVAPWIYQMRVLGYPPGYLKEAYHAPSSIVMFDDNGCPTVHKNGKKPRGFYDPEKLIDFPGFNCPMPSGVTDKCMDLGMPPMLPHQQKAVFVNYLNTANEEQQDDVICLSEIGGQCIAQSQTHHPRKTEVIIEDMEITEIDEEPKNLPDTPESPGTRELQKERERILAELDQDSTAAGDRIAIDISQSITCLDKTDVIDQSRRSVKTTATSLVIGSNDDDDSVCVVEDEIVEEEEDIASPDADEIGSRDPGDVKSRDRGDQSRDGTPNVELRDSLEPPNKRSRFTTSRDPGGMGRRTPVIPVDPAISTVEGAGIKQDTVVSSCLTPVSSDLSLVEGSSASSMRKSCSAKSLSVELGTPVSMTPVSSRESPYYEGPRYTAKPSIEAFGANIVKFEIQEQSIPCLGGGMKRLREILRKNSQKK